MISFPGLPLKPGWQNGWQKIENKFFKRLGYQISEAKGQKWDIGSFFFWTSPIPHSVSFCLSVCLWYVLLLVYHNIASIEEHRYNFDEGMQEPFARAVKGGKVTMQS